MIYHLMVMAEVMVKIMITGEVSKEVPRYIKI